MSLKFFRYFSSSNLSQEFMANYVKSSGKTCRYFHQNISESVIIKKLMVLGYMCERAKRLPAPHEWRTHHGLGFNSAYP